jgi:hypothetical protein
MALGTITRNSTNSQNTADASVGNLKVTSTDVVGDSSYPTGGSTLTPAQLGLGTVVFAVTSIKVTGAVGAASEAYYDVPTSKLVVYTTAGQVANTTVLSSNTFQITAFGY